jgi:hypothetical protein
MNFYCRSYCLLSMFRAPLCPSSGALEYNLLLRLLFAGFVVPDRFVNCFCLFGTYKFDVVLTTMQVKTTSKILAFTRTHMTQLHFSRNLYLTKIRRLLSSTYNVMSSTWTATLTIWQSCLFSPPCSLCQLRCYAVSHKPAYFRPSSLWAL